jgi:hypothetical protein
MGMEDFLVKIVLAMFAMFSGVVAVLYRQLRAMVYEKHISLKKDIVERFEANEKLFNKSLELTRSNITNEIHKELDKLKREQKKDMATDHDHLLKNIRHTGELMNSRLNEKYQKIEKEADNFLKLINK